MGKKNVKFSDVCLIPKSPCFCSKSIEESKVTPPLAVVD